MAVRRRHIRSLVEKLLDVYSIESAPVPVHEVIQKIGLEIHEEPAEDNLSGFLIRNATTQQAVIGVNGTHALVRRTFTAAHELGHYLLHDTDRVHVDRAETEFLVYLRDDVSRQGTEEEEREANLFAAELLMPVRFLQQDLAEIGSLDLVDEEGQALRSLARRYGVSTQALTFRLANLGYIRL